MSLLSESEKKDLHLAILGYLGMENHTKTQKALSEATKLTSEREHRKQLAEGWRSIVKLRKKITELQEKKKQLKEDVDNFGKGGGGQDPLPRKPARYTFKGHDKVITAVRFHPKYNQLASASEDWSIRLWEGENGQFQRKMMGHDDVVNMVAFIPKGDRLASCSADMSIKLWDLEEGKCTKTMKDAHEHNISYVVFSPDGKYLLSCSRDKTIRAWDPSTGNRKRIYTGHTDWVKYLCISPDRKTFASCGMDKKVMVWQYKSADPLMTLEGHEGEVECCIFSNAKMDDIIARKVVDSKTDEGKAEKKEYLKRKMGDNYRGGQFLISGDRNKMIRIWSIVSGRCITVFKAHRNWVRDLAIHPSGKYLFSCSDDKSINIWDVAKLKEKNPKAHKTLPSAHELFVTSIDFAQSGIPMLASGGVDSMVKVWGCK